MNFITYLESKTRKKQTEKRVGKTKTKSEKRNKYKLFSRSEILTFSKKKQIKFTIKYKNKNESLENFSNFLLKTEKFFKFLKQIAGKYPDVDEIFFIESTISEAETEAWNMGGNAIKISSFNNKDINYWTLFHELIHTYNVNVKIGFVLEGLSDFISYLFMKENNIPFKKQSDYKTMKKDFISMKRDIALYDSMKKDHNPNIDFGAYNFNTYVKSFFFWQLLYDTFGMDIIKDSFRMSLRKPKMNAVNVKNIIKDHLKRTNIKDKKAVDFLKGWLLFGEYRLTPDYYEDAKMSFLKDFKEYNEKYIVVKNDGMGGTNFSWKNSLKEKSVREYSLSIYKRIQNIVNRWIKTFLNKNPDTLIANSFKIFNQIDPKKIIFMNEIKTDNSFQDEVTKSTASKQTIDGIDVTTSYSKVFIRNPIDIKSLKESSYEINRIIVGSGKPGQNFQSYVYVQITKYENI